MTTTAEVKSTISKLAADFEVLKSNTAQMRTMLQDLINKGQGASPADLAEIADAVNKVDTGVTDETELDVKAIQPVDPTATPAPGTSTGVVGTGTGDTNADTPSGSVLTPGTTAPDPDAPA